MYTEDDVFFWAINEWSVIRMKRRFGRLAALSLAALMTLQAPFTQAVTWAQETDLTQGAVVEEMSPEDTAQQITGDIVSQNQAPEAALFELPQELEVKQSHLLLNYVYIKEVQQKTQAEGNTIVVSLEDTDTPLSDVTLKLVDVQTGETYEILASDSTGHAYEFDTKSAQLKQGVYSIAQLVYTADGVREALPVGDIPGMENTVFGVQEDPGIDAEQLADLENLQQLEGELEVQTFSQDEFSQLEDLISIDVMDLNAASEQITQQLTAAQAQPAGLAAERMQAGSVVVFLDPGHDQAHAGARANGINEEDITLKVAQYCKDYLMSTYTNVVVYMSRTTAACPHPGSSSVDDNRARVADAQNVNADAYVSIHFNSAAASASGAMVFYPNSNYNSSVGSKGSTLAAQIQEQLVKLGLRNNGIQIRNSETGDTYDDGSLADYYAVIRAAKKAGIPGVIVEHAFLTNAADAAFLKSEDNLRRLGVADAVGIANAFSLSTEEVEYDADDLTVTDIDGVNGSFKITLTGAKPADRIDKVQFKVYPTSNSSQSYLYTAQADGKKKGTYSVTGSVSNHDMETGKYKVIAYVYDAAGRKTQLRSTTFTIEEGQADTSAMKLVVKKTKNQKKVSVQLTNNDGAADVYFKVYNNKQGSRKAKQYTAQKGSAGWKAAFYMTDFKLAGDYTVIAYSKNYYGKTTKVKQESFTIDGPSMRSVTVAKINLNKGTFRLRANGVQSASGVSQVELQVRNLTGKKVTKTYKAKKKGSFYYADINFKDFNYQLGNYRFIVTAQDGNGISQTFDSVTYEFETPQPVVKAQLRAKETKLQLSAENLGIGVNVKGVRFAVSHAQGEVKKKYFDAKNSGGVYSATVKVAELGAAGTYRIQAYVKGANGKYTKTGKLQRVTVSDIEGGNVTVKQRSAGGVYLYVDSVSANSAVSKVEVKTWPTAKASAKYTYTAKQYRSDTYRAAVDPKNHKGICGTYKYQVTVTLKNGVSSQLLSGRFVIEDEDDEDSENEDGYHPIAGPNGVTVAQMMAYYQANASYPSFYAGSDAPTLKKFCTIYYNECKAENIRVEVAFAQAMKETNFLRYTGDVEIEQYNFAGIGATGGGAKGNSFSTVTLGIRAQVQHLKAYAGSEPLKKNCVDPRFEYVTRGSAPYVEWLGIPDNPYGAGWATAQNYGSSILQMIARIKSY